MFPLHRYDGLLQRLDLNAEVGYLKMDAKLGKSSNKNVQLSKINISKIYMYLSINTSSIHRFYMTACTCDPGPEPSACTCDPRKRVHSGPPDLHQGGLDNPPCKKKRFHEPQEFSTCSCHKIRTTTWAKLLYPRPPQKMKETWVPCMVPCRKKTLTKSSIY